MKQYSNEEVLERYKTFNNDKFSLIVSTTDKNGTPLTNYAPFVMSENRYYICVSSQLPHYKNMSEQKQAHLMILQDEKEASHIYARERLYFNASCEVVKDKETIFSLFDKRYGETLSFMRNMKDFEIIEFIPQEQSFVLGFGAAYVIDTDGNLKTKSISHQK